MRVLKLKYVFDFFTFFLGQRKILFFKRLPLLFQEDVSYDSIIENEPENAKKGLGSYLRWGIMFYFEYYNLITLIICDIYGLNKVYTCTHLHTVKFFDISKGCFYI